MIKRTLSLIVATAVVFFIVWLVLSLLCSSCRAETMTVERVVPPGSTLTYSEGGVVVRTVPVPVGRVRVTIEYGAPIVPRHRERPHG